MDGAESRLLELCELLKTRSSELTTQTHAQQHFLSALSDQTDARAFRSSCEPVLPRSSLLRKPVDPVPDVPVHKIQPLELDQSRVPRVPPIELFKAPRPAVEKLVRRKELARSKGWGVHPVDIQVAKSGGRREQFARGRERDVVWEVEGGDDGEGLPVNAEGAVAKKSEGVRGLPAPKKLEGMPSKLENATERTAPKRSAEHLTEAPLINTSARPLPSIPTTKSLTPKDRGDLDLSKFEKMMHAGVPEGAIVHAMLKDSIDPELLFGKRRDQAAPAAKKPPPVPQRDSAGNEGEVKESSRTSSLGTVEENEPAKRQPPPRRSSLGLAEEVENDVFPAMAIKNSLPPPRRSSAGDDVPSEASKKPPPPPRRSSAGDDVPSDASKKPPPPPRRSLAGDDVPDEASKKPPPPPNKKRSSEGSLEEEGRTEQADFTKVGTLPQAPSKFMPKPPMVDKPSKPPPPPKKIQVPESPEVQKPASAEENSKNGGGGGLAARQAMLAAMMGGAGAHKLPPAGGPAGASAGGKPSGGTPMVKQQDALPVGSLESNKKLASAAEALSKNLGKATSSKPDLAKYQKMQKTGLPQGAIEHAMKKDGVDPKILFG